MTNTEQLELLPGETWLFPEKVRSRGGKVVKLMGAFSLFVITYGLLDTANIISPHRTQNGTGGSGNHPGHSVDKVVTSETHFNVSGFVRTNTQSIEERCAHFESNELAQYRYFLIKKLGIVLSGDLFDFSALGDATSPQHEDYLEKVSEWSVTNKRGFLNRLGGYYYDVSRVSLDDATVLAFRIIEWYRDELTDGGSTFKVNATSPKSTQICQVSDCFNGTYFIRCLFGEVIEKVSFGIEHVNFTVFTPHFLPTFLDFYEYVNQGYHFDEKKWNVTEPKCSLRLGEKLRGLWILDGSGNWSWSNHQCLMNYSTSEKQVFDNVAHVVFGGDSYIRYKFFYFNQKINSEKGTNLPRKLWSQVTLNNLTFIPLTYPEDIAHSLKSFTKVIEDHRIQGKLEIVFMGVCHWTLSEKDMLSYFINIRPVFGLLETFQKVHRANVVWLNCAAFPDTNNRHRKHHRTNAALMALNQYTEHHMTKAKISVLDSHKVTFPMMYDTDDNVHYVIVNPSNKNNNKIARPGQSLIQLIMRYISLAKNKHG